MDQEEQFQKATKLPPKQHKKSFFFFVVLHFPSNQTDQTKTTTEIKTYSNNHSNINTRPKKTQKTDTTTYTNIHTYIYEGT